MPRQPGSGAEVKQKWRNNVKVILVKISRKVFWLMRKLLVNASKPEFD